MIRQDNGLAAFYIAQGYSNLIRHYFIYNVPYSQLNAEARMVFIGGHPAKYYSHQLMFVLCSVYVCVVCVCVCVCVCVTALSRFVIVSHLDNKVGKFVASYQR